MEPVAHSSCFFEQQEESSGLLRLPLMRYHSAPGSLIRSLVDPQQQHQQRQGMNMMQVPSSRSSLVDSTATHGGQQQQQQQQPNGSSILSQAMFSSGTPAAGGLSSGSSSMQSVTLNRMGSIRSGQQFEACAAAAAAAAAESVISFDQALTNEHLCNAGFDHQGASAASFMIQQNEHPAVTNLNAFVSGEECAALLRQKSSPADLISKLVEGISSASAHTNSNHQQQQQQQHKLVVPVLQPLPLLRSTSDTLSVSGAMSSREGDPGHPGGGGGGGGGDSGGGMWDGGATALIGMLPNGRKRPRDSSEEQQQQQYSDEMAYCDEEQCGLEHPALLLSRQLSLRSDLQDSVPCRLRARRGCATHPRSVAERVRRSKISDGIKKLHDLVPNMDRQTSTADMLNQAMEYIKHLQEQNEQLKEQLQEITGCKAEKSPEERKGSSEGHHSE